MKLFIKEENREVLQQLADNMSDASLTSALNYVLEAAALSVLEDVKEIKERRKRKVSAQKEIPTPQGFTPERQVYIPELDGDAVSSAFD